MWSCTTSCILYMDTSLVSVSTGCPPMDDFLLSLLSFMKNLSERFDDVVS